MRMLRQLCTEYTSLWDADIRRLEDLERTLQLIADLTGSDVFIDCMLRDGSAAVVVAEAKPLSEGSAYNYAVAGKMAPPDKEPAVFHAFTSGMPVRDLKAVTQENQLVKQDVVPIRGERGQIIAVLIPSPPGAGGHMAMGDSHVPAQEAQNLPFLRFKGNVPDGVFSLVAFAHMGKFNHGRPSLK